MAGVSDFLSPRAKTTLEVDLTNRLEPFDGFCFPQSGTLPEICASL